GMEGWAARAPHPAEEDGEGIAQREVRRGLDPRIHGDDPREARRRAFGVLCRCVGDEDATHAVAEREELAARLTPPDLIQQRIDVCGIAAPVARAPALASRAAKPALMGNVDE